MEHKSEGQLRGASLGERQFEFVLDRRGSRKHLGCSGRWVLEQGCPWAVAAHRAMWQSSCCAGAAPKTRAVQLGWTETGADGPWDQLPLSADLLGADRWVNSFNQP